VAEAGGTADPTDRRKNCQVGALITVPAGWTSTSSTEETFAGPLNGYWDTSDVAPVLIYTPCSEQRVLNINTELRVDGGTSTGRSSMSMKSSDGDVDTLFNFSWTRC
jgi:hypothetical protein